MPGLIDCHTHAVFGGDRAAEFELRAQGAGYEQIHAAGGGIAASVRETRAAAADGTLAELLDRHLVLDGAPRGRPPPRSSRATASTATPSWPCSTPPPRPPDRDRAHLPRRPRGRPRVGRRRRLPGLRDRRGAAGGGRPAEAADVFLERGALRPRPGRALPARRGRPRPGAAAARRPVQRGAAASSSRSSFGRRSVDHLEATGAEGAAALAASDVAARAAAGLRGHARPAAAARPGADRGRGHRRRWPPT